MVSGRSHGADTVDTSRETTSNIGLQTTISVSGIVDTLEEGELRWVRRLLSVDVITERLDGDMGMTNDLTTLQRLRGGIVGVIRVRESTSLKVVDLQLDLEVLVCLNILHSLRALNDG